MKSRTQELLDKSIAAMVSAIEIYNKPDFLYRGETFAILAINSWELLFKAKVLQENNNKVTALYVYEYKKKKNGEKSKKKVVKKTRSQNPFTHSLEFMGVRFVERKLLEATVMKNIEALIELRDSAVHFYNYSLQFNIRLQEIGTASLRNYVLLMKEWFDKDLAKYNFYLMPLSFISLDESIDVILLNNEEKNFVKFIDALEDESVDDNTGSAYSIALNIDIGFSKSKSKDAIKMVLSNDPDATKITFTEEQIRERYPLDYRALTDICNKRYIDFKVNTKYHRLRKSFESKPQYAHQRYLDPGNLNSSIKIFYNHAILNEFDKYYDREQVKS